MAFTLPNFEFESFADLSNRVAATVAATTNGQQFSPNATSVTPASAGNNGFKAGATSFLDRVLDTAGSFGEGILNLKLFDKFTESQATAQAAAQATGNNQTGSSNASAGSGSSSINWMKWGAIGGASILVIMAVAMLVKD